MSARIPVSVQEQDVVRKISLYLKRIHQGKVRDTFATLSPYHLLQHATDRLSIFDFVLPGIVRCKGEVLTALTVFWSQELFPNGLGSHIEAYGPAIDSFLPKELQGDSRIQASSLVVKKLHMIPVECIMRGYLTGSGWKDYRQTGKVCGINLSLGMRDGDRIRPSIFTPSTKAESGHDENISFEKMAEIVGSQELAEDMKKRSMSLYSAALRMAHEKGIIIADTKFEWGLNENILYLGDEIITADSSRFWLFSEWEEFQRKGGGSPTSFDKQYVRNFGKNIKTPFEKGGKSLTGIHGLDLENSEHVLFVHCLNIPGDVLENTYKIYADIFYRLTRMRLPDFQRNVMGILTDFQ